MSKRLLIMAYFFPPLAGGGVHRVLGFTRYLPQHGWHCTVVCAGAEDYWVTDSSLLERVHAETDVVRVAGGSALSAWLRVRRGDRGKRSGSMFSGLRALSDWWLLPDSYGGWSKRAASQVAGRLRDGRFDALLTSSPPDSVHDAVCRMRRPPALPWVADFRDPWVGLHLRKPPTRWHRARHEALERRVLRSADRVLVASRTHADWIERAEPDVSQAGRVVHLPNGYEPAVAPPAAAPENDEDAGRFLMVFTGTMSLMPDTMVFFDALHELVERRSEARRKIRVRLVGPFDADDEDRVLALGLKGLVRFEGPQSHERARQLQRRADLLLLWKPHRAPTMVPGKLYEYLDSGRPLIGVLEAGEEVTRMVERARGVVVRPGDARGLSEALETCYSAWAEGAPVQSSRPAWLNEHTREHLSGRLAAELDTLTTR